MITITERSKEFTPVEEYLMTVSPAIVSLKDVENDTHITVAGTLKFTDEKDNGDTSEILSIITPDNVVYSCQSATFKRSLKDIQSIMKDTVFTIIKTSGVTKNGREFINCVLDVATLM